MSHQFTYTKPLEQHLLLSDDLFCRFFTEKVWDIIVSETNGHAETFVKYYSNRSAMGVC